MHNPTPAADVNCTEQVPHFDELLSGIEVRRARFASLGWVDRGVAGFRLAARFRLAEG